ncbi:ssDNA-binding protein, mitochondrial [Lambiella insularis]|nr:ssDNA-binding protein, mitochondrial [Lambiella insularis]
MPPLPLRPTLLRPLPLRRLFHSTPPSRVAKITIVGHLAAEPELMPTSTGTDMVRYAVGTGYGPRENRQTSWWRVASFVKEGEGRDRILALPKGTLVYVEGEASMRKYESKEGKAESALSIVQQKMEVLRRPDAQFPSPEERLDQE